MNFMSTYWCDNSSSIYTLRFSTGTDIYLIFVVILLVVNGGFVMLGVFIHYVFMMPGLNIAMLIVVTLLVVMLTVFKLIVVMLNFVMLPVIAPFLSQV
jgi:hypothetical protein